MIWMGMGIEGGAIHSEGRTSLVYVLTGVPASIAIPYFAEIIKQAAFAGVAMADGKTCAGPVVQFTAGVLGQAIGVRGAIVAAYTPYVGSRVALSCVDGTPAFAAFNIGTAFAANGNGALPPAIWVPPNGVGPADEGRLRAAVVLWAQRVASYLAPIVQTLKVFAFGVCCARHILRGRRIGYEPAATAVGSVRLADFALVASGQDTVVMTAAFITVTRCAHGVVGTICSEAQRLAGPAPAVDAGTKRYTPSISVILARFNTNIVSTSPNGCAAKVCDAIAVIRARIAPARKRHALADVSRMARGKHTFFVAYTIVVAAGA